MGVLGDIFGWYLGRDCVGAMLLGAVSVSSSRAGCCDFHTQLPTVAWLAMRRETELNVVQSLRLNTEEEKKASCGSVHCRIHPDLCITPVSGACGSEHRGGAVAAEPPGCSPPCLQAQAALGSHFPEGRLAALWLGALPSQTSTGPRRFLHPTHESAAKTLSPPPPP